MTTEAERGMDEHDSSKMISVLLICARPFQKHLEYGNLR